MQPDWLDKVEYPFTSRYWQVQGNKMHYIDEGKGDTILFIHGTPSWSFDFRKVFASLSLQYRCIAIDLIGFGLSDKPSEYDYSTQHHSETLEKFVIAQNLKDLTLVAHDFGVSIGMSMAFNHPDRIRQFVILNSWLWSAEENPEYIRLRKILKNLLLPFFYKYFNFSPRFVLPSTFGDNKLSKALKRQYVKPFHKISERKAPLAFVKSLLNDQSWFESLWINRNNINSQPTLFMWGMKDPIIGPHYLEKFMSGFPNNKVVKIPTAGHFPQEEQPAIVTEAIQVFMKKWSLSKVPLNSQVDKANK
ncbi:MAG: alpha/beta fold hydrolase [Bacteroidota bacterium]|nr:alpha/beta fold hydrolase [Bacteroidota bacterium]